MKKLFLKNWRSKVVVPIVFLLMNTSAFAAKSSKKLPFEDSMDILGDAISGPFLMTTSIIMIVVTCVMLAFGEWGDGFKKIINIVLWLSVAFSVTSFIKATFVQGAVF